MKIPYTLLAFSIQLLILLLAAGVRADDIPIAPIRPGLHQNWPNSFRLQNDFLDVIIDPDTGRMVYISYHNHPNIFSLGTNRTARTTSGGETLYPVSTEQFKDIQPAHPVPGLIGGSWSGRAWVSADGTQICLLTRDYPAPLELKCSRKIMLYKNEPAVHVRQRVERVGRTSNIPATLKNVVRMQPPKRIVLPLDPGKKLRRFNGTPENKNLTIGPHAAVYQAAPGTPADLATESARQWVAAELNDFVVIARTRVEAGLGAFPEHCTARVHWPAGADYAQLETFSRQRRLKAGDLIDNSFILEFHLIERGLSDADLAQTIRHLQGEAPKVDTK